MFNRISNSEINAALKQLGLTEKDVLIQDPKCEIIFSKAKLLQNKKTIMSADKVEMYRRDFLERHNKSLSADISNLSAVIMALNSEKVTVWHCCNRDGYGYYTVSNGKTKRYVSSEYDLECVGGCWSMHVYERLYFAQVYLTKFLKAVKAEIFKRFSAVMPLKSLYIAYILTDLDKEENEYINMDYPYDEEDKRNYEIAREHQSKFIKNRAKEIEQYNAVVQNGGDYWSYYNGADNHEYSCVSDILNKAMSDIYKSREELEACELWQEAREIISVLQDTQTTLYSSRQKLVIQTERKQDKNKNHFIIGISGSGKAIHPWDNLKRCPKCGCYPWLVGKDMKNYESGSPYTVICTNKGKCRCKSIQSDNLELCIKDWNKKHRKYADKSCKR